MPEALVIPVLGEKPAAAVPAAPALAEGDPIVQDTGEQATPAKPEAKPGVVAEATPEQVAKRNQNRLDRKLDKAFRERAEQQARADFLERQLAEERVKNAPARPEGKPTFEQFEYDPEKYAAASAEYATKQAAKESEAKQRAETGKQQQQRLVSAWEEKVARADDKYDDFQQIVGHLQPNNPAVMALMEAENGEDIAYHLGKNPAEAHRIAQLPPLSQAREIGKLEARLLSEPKTPKLPSGAPAPIKPVGGSSSASTKSLSEMDQNEFEKKRRAQIAARR